MDKSKDGSCEQQCAHLCPHVSCSASQLSLLNNLQAIERAAPWLPTCVQSSFHYQTASTYIGTLMGVRQAFCSTLSLHAFCTAVDIPSHWPGLRASVAPLDIELWQFYYDIPQMMLLLKTNRCLWLALPDCTCCMYEVNRKAHHFDSLYWPLKALLLAFVPSVIN